MTFNYGQINKWSIFENVVNIFTFVLGGKFRCFKLEFIRKFFSTVINLSTFTIQAERNGVENRILLVTDVFEIRR